jgi:DNA-binding transcriptional MerR regulator
LVDWAYKQEAQVFDVKNVERLLKHSGKSKDDVKIIMTHMQYSERMIGDQGVKIGQKGQVQELSEVEKTEFKLSKTSKELEQKIEDIQQKIDTARDKAKLALKNGDKSKATNFCKERKGLIRIESTLRGMQMKIEKQSFGKYTHKLHFSLPLTN